MITRKIYIVFIAVIHLFLSSCNKFLEEPSDKSLTIPKTVADLRALLNNVSRMATNFAAAGEISSDDYYLTSQDLASLNYESDRRLYLWQPDYVARVESPAQEEWGTCYSAIFICNTVLEALDDYGHVGTEADRTRGQALAYRAARYLDGLQIWCLPYDATTSSTDMGMVLRTDPDMSTPSVRSSVQQTYDLVIKDLLAAAELIPESDVFGFLPTKAGVYGLLARAYLIMGNYGEALRYAELCHQRADYLIDFSTLNPNANFPIPTASEVSQEVILRNYMASNSVLSNTVAKISPEVYDLYDDKDLRKSIYFRANGDGTFGFRGNHTGYGSMASDVTTSEICLIMAEVYARQNQLNEAADILNQVLAKRYSAENFEPVHFGDSEEALETVLIERRKELIMRGLRWIDIRRLNKEGRNIVLRRTVDGQTYTLPPNDLRYAIALPEDLLMLTDILQNPR